MTIFGVSMVRDEEDILSYTLPRMAQQLDHCIVCDNLSTDRTREILEEVAEEWGNITICDDPDPAYTQSHKMSHLGRIAAEQGADWVVPFDADEVFLLGPMPEDAEIVACELYDYRATGLDDPSESDPVNRMRWRHERHGPLPKAVCRVLPGLVIEQGNHGAHYPGPVRTVDLRYRVYHYPYRSPEQMARKAVNGGAAYAAAGNLLPPTTGQHWREYARFYEERGQEAIDEIFNTWYYAEDPENWSVDTLVHDPCPVSLIAT